MRSFVALILVLLLLVGGAYVLFGGADVSPVAPATTGASIGVEAAPASARVVVGAEDARPDERSAALPHGRLVGSVVDAAGRPLGGARLLVRPADGLGDSRWTTSRLDGTWSAEVPFPGRWSVECAALGKRTRSTVVEVADDDPHAIATARADFVLLGERRLQLSLCDAQGEPMAARLQADGLDPVQGGRVEVAQDEAPAQELPARLHLGAGGMAVEVLEGLPLRVRWLAGPVVLADGVADERAVALELRADFAQLRAQACWVSVELDPLEQRAAQLLFATGGGPLRPADARRAGRVLLLPAAPGPAILELRRDDCATLRHEFEVAQGGATALGPQPCEPRCTLHGVLLGRDGAPLPGEVLLEPAGQADPARHPRSVRAGSGGRWSCSDVAPGDWTVRGAADGEPLRVTLPLPPQAARDGISLRAALSAPVPPAPSRRP